VTDVEQRANVRMGQCGDQFRLTGEPGLKIRMGIAENLDGDGAVEPRVARAIDLPPIPPLPSSAKTS
jgi:hypothetical protein